MGKNEASCEEMTSRADALGSLGAEVPPELVAKAAALLGAGEMGAEENRRAGAREPRVVAVRVVGPRGRKVVRVPLDVPVGDLAEVLAEGAGVETVASVSLRSGQLILPHETLGKLGVGAGSTLQVDELPSPEPVFGYGAPRGYQTGRRPVSRGHRAFFGAVAAAVVVGMFFAGGAVQGGGQGPPAPAAVKLAKAAADAWMSGKRFSGPARGDVGSLLGRRGPAVTAYVEPAGSWSAPGLLSEQFVVGSSAGTYGLSVVVYKGYVVYPPTPSPLPFVEPPGAHVPETGTSATANMDQSVTNWAIATFAPAGALRPADLGLAGRVQVLDEWRPRSGADLVARVEVPLASADGFTAHEAREELLAAQEAVLTGRRAVVGGAVGLRRAEDKAKADDTAAQQAAQVVSAGAPPSKSVAAAEAAAASAQETVSKDENSFRAAENQLGAAERQEASAKAELTRADSKPLSATGVYDVAFDHQGKVVAWAPAEYGA